MFLLPHFEQLQISTRDARPILSSLVIGPRCPVQLRSEPSLPQGQGGLFVHVKKSLLNQERTREANSREDNPGDCEELLQFEMSVEIGIRDRANVNNEESAS